jgi:hypothetical protein
VLVSRISRKGNTSLPSTGPMADTAVKQGSQSNSGALPPTATHDGSTTREIKPDERLPELPQRDNTTAQRGKNGDTSHPKRNGTRQETPRALTDDELLEQSLSKLKKGNLAYITPERMKAGSIAHVTARIG